MWSALRSDLKEFATTIATDGHAIRDKIETNLIPTNNSDADDNDDDVIDDSYNQDLVIGEHGEVAYLAGDHDDFRAVNGPLYEAKREAQRRAELEETYLTPLLTSEVNGSKTGYLSRKKGSVEDIAKERNQEEFGTNPEEETLKFEPSPLPVEENVTDPHEEAKDTFQQEETIKDSEVISDAAAVTDDNQEEDRNDQFSAVEGGGDDDPDVIEFLNSFQIESKTNDIGEILAKYPDTIGLLFEDLVPVTVTYEQFWQRYYYRCDPERIQLEWELERERIKQERKEFIDKGKNTVKILFGGALKVIKGTAVNKVTNDAGQENESIYEKYQAELEQKRKALQEASSLGIQDQKQDNSTKIKSTGGFGALFANVRPPFVMNTAVDDEDDDINSQDDVNASDLDADTEDDADQEQEEEDFGWGSDEEEISVEEEEGDDVTEGTEEVVFSSNALEESKTMQQLQLELAAALEKNKNLEKIVRDQQEQLRVQSEDGIDSNIQSELEKLKLELFSKDSELAAVKASLEEIEDDKTHEQNFELKHLRSELQRKELQLEKFQETFREADAMQDEEDAKDSEMLAEALDTITALQSELESSKLEASQELSQMRDQYEDQITEMKNELKELSDALVENKEIVSSLQNELEVKDVEISNVKNQCAALEESSKIELDHAMEKVSSLEKELSQSGSSQDQLETKESIKRLKSDIEALRNVSSENEKEAAKIISALQLELTSSNSELAATKASTHEEIQKLKESIVNYENSKASLLSEIASNKEEISHLQIAINGANTADRQHALDLVSSLQSELNDTKEECSKLQNEIDRIRNSKDNDQSENTHALDEAKEAIEILEKSLAESKLFASQQSAELSSMLETSKSIFDETKKKLETEVANLNSKVESLEKEKITVENELSLLKSKLDEYQVNDENGKVTCESPSPSSPNNEGSSFSSGVEVQKTSASALDMNDGDGDAEDGGWGDEWSDDEDH
mmetsp:Transcript_265/g.437  ORF Transcript_265/g.437 Transcript_265/m.437 type:complete len:977 (-) Transcript_265:217-3147(-)|eukprot:CAMPEP_0176503256 /NCGR_PEP_ID=MMETSP0200_2-20121128/15261_1 /TAXON_ID=947934 /ORGANISM="Chaetoceros sp., Strain GSL56" /LENGTH=976 /DNA_ID=CAMNT_0017902525 /DNA_START=149 /DNA_END=3079 /DNA_ORIENTATION=+